MSNLLSFGRQLQASHRGKVNRLFHLFSGLDLPIGARLKVETAPDGAQPEGDL
jgi:hypothetical protein